MTRLHHVDDLLAVLSRYGRIRERLAVTKFKTPEGIVETAAFSCLFTLNERPMRSGELAEHLFADPSTVSRHIASLVRLGYVRREADTRDGRATILVLTDSGRAQVTAVREHRMQAFDAMLADFTTDEVADLAHLMGRVVAAAEDLAATVHTTAETPDRAPGDTTLDTTTGRPDTAPGPDTVGPHRHHDQTGVTPAQFTAERREKASR